MRLTLSLPKKLLTLQRAEGGKGKRHDEHKVRSLLEQWGGEGARGKEVDGTVDILQVFQRFATPPSPVDAPMDKTMDTTLDTTVDNEDDELDDALFGAELRLSVPATAWEIGALLRALSAPHDSFAVEVALDQMVISPDKHQPDAGVVTFHNFIRWWHEHKDVFYFVVKSDRGLSGVELVAQQQGPLSAGRVVTSKANISLLTPRTPRSMRTSTPRSRRASTPRSFGGGVSSGLTRLRSSASLGAGTRSLSRGRVRHVATPRLTVRTTTATGTATGSVGTGDDVVLPSAGAINRVVYQGSEKNPVG